MATAEDLAWAAGLFEGEGTICLDTTRHERGTGRLQVQVSLATTDEDVARRFQAVLAVGSVYGPYRAKGGTKLVWVWRARRLAEAEQVQNLIGPHLGVRRRQQFADVLAAKAESDRTFQPKTPGKKPGPSLIEGQMKL